jgi:hypothetical protein
MRRAGKTGLEGLNHAQKNVHRAQFSVHNLENKQEFIF